MKIMQRKKIAIVGGGVIGLCCALELSMKHEVSIFAEKLGVQSDSVKATAVWHVYLVPETEKILNWAQFTLQKLINLSLANSDVGVETIAGVELFRKNPKVIPSWSHIPKFFQMLTVDEVASFNDYAKTDLSEDEIYLLKNKPVLWGYHIQVPAADMYKYLTWLEKNVISNGVHIINERIDNFNRFEKDFDLVVNCSGFGARELVNDLDFEVYKGQYYVIKATSTSPKNYIGDDDHPGGMAYMIPRANEIMIGGCAEKNIENLELTLTWPEVINRAGLYVPWLKQHLNAIESGHTVVGIRPCRTSGVRLELDTNIAKIPVIHNYGHGGSGFSLSWGCAEAVKGIIDNI